MADVELFFNGINGATGDYGLPPMTGAKLAEFIKGERTPTNLAELRKKKQDAEKKMLGPKTGVDPKKLEEAGWGIIFPYGHDPAIKEALSELIELRRGQAGDHFEIYDGSKAYRQGESKTDFLVRHNTGAGPADPEQMPYYLLIVGSPEAIPYEFQYQLDVQRAVGRIYFDTLQEYANYASSVVRAEEDGVKLTREVSFFGVANKDDENTEISMNDLIKPLHEEIAQAKTGWHYNTILQDQATRDQLLQSLGGDQTPALLVTASHGMEFDLGDLRQFPHQGALLCQDWPGPEEWKDSAGNLRPIPEDFYVAGDHISSDANMLGLIGFFFACFGGGTPDLDNFYKRAFRKQKRIAPYPFVANLPLRMLAHPRGGALAVIAHIDRAWSYSFKWPGTKLRTTNTFESVLTDLLDGASVGAAMEHFNGLWAELATVLNDRLEKIEVGLEVDDIDLSLMWTANNDARNYVVLGDPAVRLPVGKTDETTEDRPVIQVKTIQGEAKQLDWVKREKYSPTSAGA